MRSRFPPGLLALLVALPLSSAAADSQWLSVARDSELRFAARYEGEEIPGRFARFEVRLTADAGTGEPTALAVEVDMGSADMNDDEINEELSGPDWFAAARFPDARFIADDIRSRGDGFVASGRLRIRDIEQSLEVPFTWRPDGERSVLTGSVDLPRLAWQVGIGEWAEDDSLADRVTVAFDVVLIREP